PALLYLSDHLLSGDRLGQCGEHVVLRRSGARGLLDDEPLLFSAGIVAGDDTDADPREAGGECSSGALPPGDLSIAASVDHVCDGFDAHGVGLLSVLADDDDAGVTLDVERVLEAERTHAVAERT